MVMLDTVDAALARVVAEADEVTVPDDATPLDFLQAVYRDSGQRMPRRMRAAEAALPFVHPKLSVAANVYSFAAQMEEASRRIGKSNVIDATANHSALHVGHDQ
jgi:hypothetical protein